MNEGKSVDYTVIEVKKDMVMEFTYEPVKPTIYFLKGFNGSVNWINIKNCQGRYFIRPLKK